jgi:lipopolysaccharide/colanic/teichoic acid biosynthesis glycosyltransferase
VKRLFDLLVSSLALLVLSPVFLVIACWIKWDSKGPVFFRQTRVGRYETSFKIIKFRSMISVQADGAPQLTVGRDTRITRCGAWIRKTKLDELPQLLNVWMGHMSLVGPRPEVPKYVALYSEDDRALVFSVRPGITDEASIEYRQESQILAQATDPEAAYRTVVLPDKLKYYRAYVREHSLWGDLSILWRTVWLVLRP